MFDYFLIYNRTSRDFIWISVMQISIPAKKGAGPSFANGYLQGIK